VPTLGAYTAVLHDRPLDDALAVLRELGLQGAEVNSGGFLPSVHLPVADIRSSADARAEYLGRFAAHDLTLTALNCNGNPLHPDPEVRLRHGRDVFEAIELAALLGVRRVVTMSGLPGTDPAGRLPAWAPLPWESSQLDVRDYQWDEVAIPYWRQVQARAADADVRVCLEMHPHNVVYNPGTMLRLAESIEATHVGAEMDPSHLMWQGIDPVAAIGALDGLVYNAAAKDVRINPAARVHGVLADGHGRVDAGDPDAVPLGGRYTLSRWPEHSSWDFVAVGRGHDVAYWAEFLRALASVDPDMAVNIEHEDAELDRVEGLRFAAETLRAAAERVPR
jgi:sugar phosphate isomerase/epimerase